MMRLKYSKLSTIQTARLCEHFVAGTPARTAAELVGVNKNSAALFYHRLREIIAAQIEDGSPIEGDESYFGGHRKGKRGRGAAGKVAVFGILKRGGRVYTKMILNSRQTALIPIIKAKVEPDSIVFSDSFPAYDVLDVAGLRHHRINHQKSFVIGPGSHINGIENFWSQTKRHMRRYNGIPRHHFHLFLKECEWRFNYGSPAELLKILRTWIKLSISKAC
ncbi:IS1595 family transposase [Mesorhizobium sp. IMUNJ 23232]|uniref:IS1595 family transposase n=1 Tax=Mesorhizobium sp. IMUNJ 23232 TaxID=3376064 RepID=UPI003796B045